MAIRKSAEIGVEISQPGPKPVQAVLDIAHIPTFPFLRVVFSETNKMQTFVVNVEVAPALYKVLSESFGGDETIIFLDLAANSLGFWGIEMMRSIHLLVKLGIMTPIDQWLTTSRERISRLLSKQAGSPLEPTKSTKEIAETAKLMLDAGGLLAEIESKPHLLHMAEDVVSSARKDLDSAIYRVAMAVYHAKRLSGQPALESLEDPGQIYLSFTSSETGRAKFEDVVQLMQGIDTPERSEFVRTFMCFIVGVYLCNTALQAK